MAGQIVGFVAVGWSLFIFLQKNRSRLLCFKLVADFLWILHFFLIGGYSAMVTTGIAVFRELLFLNRDKKKSLQSPLWVVLFVFLYAVSAALTWKNGFSLLPAIGVSLSTIGFWNRDVTRIRLLGLGNSLCMFVYGLAMGSVATVINEVITVFTIVFATVRLHWARRKILREHAERTE